MITALNQIIHQIFRKNNLEGLTREEADDYVKHHPYSAAGRLIAALKNDPVEADDISLYFYNPVWYQLLKDQLSHVQQESSLPLEPAVSPAGGIIIDSEKEAEEIIKEEYHEEETIHIEEESPADAASFQQNEAILPEVEIQTHVEELESSESIEEEISIPSEEETPSESGSLHQHAENLQEEEIQHQLEEQENEAVSGFQESSESYTEVLSIPLAAETSSESLEENPAENSEEVNHDEPEEKGELTTEFEEIAKELTENTEINDGKLTEELVKESAEIAENKITKASNADSLLFMPYHSVDFFASQGIKLSETELGKDKFGKQLKSFTEWLKSMKKLPANADDAELDTVAEIKLTRIAEASLSENQIDTEAMAEVWEKQGKFKKAIEIYEKLSLQNPAKSHYFADKIQKIKNTGE